MLHAIMYISESSNNVIADVLRRFSGRTLISEIMSFFKIQLTLNL